MRAPKTDTELRREQILEAALDLIGTVGVTGLSIAAIAERVGIVPSAIYRHFQSKDEVLDAVLLSLRSRLLGNVARVRKETAGALPRLQSLMRRHARMLAEYRAIPLVVFSDGIYAGHPERKARVAEIITAYLQGIGRIIEEGQQEGSIRQEIEPRTASVMFLGLILPAAVLWNVSAGEFDIVGHVEKAWPSFTRCIAAAGG